MGQPSIPTLRLAVAGIVGRFGRQPKRAPSLYDLLPHANALARLPARTEIVPADAIEGTTRHPSNTRVDFLPWTRPNAHWLHDWHRILDAHERLLILPPVDLIKAGGRYFVVDGHKRVAAARRIGAMLDANVIELRVRGDGGWAQETVRPRISPSAA